MQKNHVQIALAAGAFALAAVLELSGADISVIVAGASAILSGLGGYNTLNPNLRSSEKSENCPCPTPFTCGEDECCGDPNNCQLEGDN